MTTPAITVTEFLGTINETLAFAFPLVTVEGEVSGFKVNQGKFAFFDVKDDANVLNCFMMLYQLKLPLEDGMKVRVTGTAKVTKFSKFSFTVKSVELAGEGELRRAMELLRQKLAAEGLFSASRKRLLPPYPQRIGLITSQTSAAYADFIKILNARWGGARVLLADVTVQGITAPDQIVAAIEAFNRLPEPVDVLVLIRGGGSLEDLSAFSTEPVARAVAASRTPMVVGVGHEVDVSLADHAADVRAATPTDAARLVVPDRGELLAAIDHTQAVMLRGLVQHVRDASYRRSVALAALPTLLAAPRQRVLQLHGDMQQQGLLYSRQIQAYRQRVQHAEVRAHTLLTPAKQAVAVHSAWLNREFARFTRLGLPGARQAVFVSGGRLSEAHSRQVISTQARLTAATLRLQALDPRRILARGYAVVRQNGQLVRNPQAVLPGSRLMLQLDQGTLEATTDAN